MKIIQSIIITLIATAIAVAAVFGVKYLNVSSQAESNRQQKSERLQACKEQAKLEGVPETWIQNADRLLHCERFRERHRKNQLYR